MSLVIPDAGTTPYIASIPGAGTCTEKPCLFNLELDPRGTNSCSSLRLTRTVHHIRSCQHHFHIESALRIDALMPPSPLNPSDPWAVLLSGSCHVSETNDLAEKEPALTSKLFERYKQLARSMYAPNMPQARKRLDHDLGLSAAAAALEAPDACDNDNCWEQKANELQLQREAMAVAATNQNAAVQCWGTRGTPLQQLTATTWHLGSEDIFSFHVIQGGGGSEISMQIVQGCGNCAFTAGVGSLTANEIALIAYGKGLNVTHSGTLLTNQDGSCRIRWVSKTNHWADFCQGIPCKGGTSKHGGVACDKMLTNGGIWQPYVETPGWPLI